MNRVDAPPKPPDGRALNPVLLAPGPHVPGFPPLDAGLLATAGLDDDDCTRLTAILEHNVASGRAARIMQRMSAAEQEAAAQAHSPRPSPDAAPWLAYQRRVVQTYLAERSRLLALETSQDDAWWALERRLQQSARRMLTHQGASGAFADDRAAELAQQACVLIFRAVFPCDVAFDPWSHTVLRNVVRGAHSRSKDLLDRQPFIHSLDDLQECGEGDEFTSGVPAQAGRGWYAQPPAPVGNGQAPGDAEGASEQMQELIDAIRQMRSQKRRAVLVYTYFSGLDDGEIADKLGCNRDGVQVLRHRALRQLRSMVGPGAQSDAGEHSVP